MDKEVVVHICNGILLSHKKEHIWGYSNEVDEPRACYAEWSQKEENKYHILMHMYMESTKMVLMTYLQGRNGDTDIENRLVVKVGEGEDGTSWENNKETDILPYVK